MIFFSNDTVAEQFLERLANSDLHKAYAALPQFRTNLSDTCRAMFDGYGAEIDKNPAMANNVPKIHFFESRGYYESITSSKRTQPKQQLTEMLNWQSLLQTATWNQFMGYFDVNASRIDALYNELAIDADTIHKIEDGHDGQCDHAIEALVRVCGAHDPFYLDEVGTCVNITRMHELAFPDTATPPLIWMDLENTEKPFSLTCDKEDVCGQTLSS